MSRTTPFLSLVAFLTVCLLWGLTWWPVKVAAEHVPPIFLAAARFTLAGALYLLWSRLAGLTLATPRPGRLAVSALLVTVGCYGPLFWGIARAPTGLSAIVNFALIPVFSIALGALHREEVITGRRLAAIGLGAAGLALLFLGRSSGADGTSVAAGLAAVVLGTLSYAWGAVLSRPLMPGLAPVALAAWQTFGGGLALFALAFALEPVTVADFGDLLRWPVWPAFAFLVVGGSLVAFTLYLGLLRDWGPFRAGLYAFVSPAIAVLVGVLALDEAFGWTEAAGAAVLFSATVLALRRG